MATKQDRDGFDAALKEMYLPRLQSTVNKGRILSEHLRREAGMTDATGRQAIVPVNLRPSEAIGARGDGEALPSPQSQNFQPVKIQYKYNYATVRLTHPVIVSSKNDKGSFVRAVSAEFDGIRRDLQNDVNRQWFGDGTGVIGRASNGNTSSDGVALTVDTGHSIKANMFIDSDASKSGGSSSSDQMSGEQVSAVDDDGVTITLVADGGQWQDNDYIFRKGSAGNEMMGLLGIVDSGVASQGADGPYVTTLHAISRADGAYPEWRARVNHNSGTARAISETIIDDAILDCQEASEGETDLIISTSRQYRKASHILTGDRRYTPSMRLRGGFTALDWGGIPFVWDRDCPIDSGGDHMLFGLDMNDLMLLELQDWDFDDTDGSVLHRQAGYAYYDATLFYYGQLGCLAPDDQFVIRDLSA
jgi:hypothetical protein